MSSRLTLMAVHAHPDDEAIGTGGVLARYGSEGIRTVLVTCTNGELGDLPGGVKPDTDGHDEERVVAMRRTELAESCRALGVAQLEILGYRDSGMMGWPQNDEPGCFWQTPLEEGAGRLAALMQTYRPDVVVTYDENGFYGHPDHIQANRITLAAAEATGIPRKLYYTALAKGRVKEMARAARAGEIEVPEEMLDFDPENMDWGTEDHLITTILDVRSAIEAKRASIAAHVSQSENISFLKLPDVTFALFFGHEEFVRHFDNTGAPLPEDDLFAGLR